MSRRYAEALVAILKRTVPPRLTLMSVAKPWIDGSPAPLMSHSLAGFPGFEFSQAMALTTGGPQGPWASGFDGRPSITPATRESTTLKLSHHRMPGTR